MVKRQSNTSDFSFITLEIIPIQHYIFFNKRINRSETMNMLVRTPWNLLDQWHNEMDQLLNTPSGRDDTSLVEGSD